VFAVPASNQEEKPVGVETAIELLDDADVFDIGYEERAVIDMGN
jgi:hypothetical protein